MDKIIEELKNKFHKSLDQHGYGFQYSVLKCCEELLNNGSSWVFLASEVPVEVQNFNTHIDFILSNNNSTILLAECKRANPSLSNWCFAKAPITLRNRQLHNYLILEYIDRLDTDEKNVSHPQGVSQLRNNVSIKSIEGLENYHISLDIKSQNKGDKHDSGKGAIQDALTQIFRGINGFIELLYKYEQLVEKDKKNKLIPVIFTTAKIWVSDVDLSNTDTKDGKIIDTDFNLKEKKWISYQYNISQFLKHSHSKSSSEMKSDFAALIEHEFVRTVFIVNSSGIDDFLIWSSKI